MIYVEDNFLPQDQFLTLRDTITKRYVPGHFKSEAEKLGYESQRLTWHNQDADWLEGCRFLGIAAVPAIEKIIKTFKAQNINPLNYSVWFAYTFNNTGVVAHRDGALRFSTREHTYTSLLYTSDWQEGWGGELVFGNPIIDNNKKLVSVEAYKTINPIPNRMVFFSRDEVHEVKKVTHPDNNFCRMALGSGWSSLEDNKTYKMV